MASPCGHCEDAGTKVSATIVSNGPKAIASANEGTPIIIKFPREQMSTDLYNVARCCTGPSPWQRRASPFVVVGVVSPNAAEKAASQ
jgi:hypothetical protein